MKPPKYKGANTPVTKLLEKQTKISQSNFKNDRHQSDTQRKERKPEKYEKKIQSPNSNLPVNNIPRQGTILENQRKNTTRLTPNGQLLFPTTRIQKNFLRD